MDFIKNLKTNKRGFSLVELLIVISIVAIISTIGTVSFLNFKTKKTLDVEVEAVIAEIRGVMSRARSQQDGLQWWIHFENPAGTSKNFYTICSGTYTSSGVDCAAEGGTKFFRRTLDTAVDFIDPADGTSKDMVFKKSTGLPTQSVEITLSTNTLQQKVDINTAGLVTRTIIQ